MMNSLKSEVGVQMRDGFGCIQSKLDVDRHASASGIQFHEKSAAAGAPGIVTMSGNGKGFLIGVSMAAGHRRRIFSEHHSSVHEFDHGGVYIRNTADDYKAELAGSFEFILMEIPESTLVDLADKCDIAQISELSQTLGKPDPTLANLLGVMVPLSTGRNPSALFLDQMALAIGIYVVRNYGNGRASYSSKRRILSKRQEVAAKELIRSSLDGRICIAHLARECSLSEGYFLKAFRETTGRTPHQWLNQERLREATELLLQSRLSIAEISDACGFGDQSHFARVFSAAMGAPPSVWRKQNGLLDRMRPLPD